MDQLFSFLASQNGRYARMAAGIILIVIGVLVGGTAGTIIGIIGLVPLAAGAFDFCVFAPLFGLQFRGKDLRYQLDQRKKSSEE